MKHGLLAIFFGSLVAAAVNADDWPQFRGPERTGVSKEKGLLKAWPKNGPALAWTFKNAGLGHSSIAVAKGVVYTLGTDYDAKGPINSAKDEYVIALDEKSGNELWRVKIGPLYTYKGNTYGDGPRSTPTVDGNFLYALSGLGQLVCVDVTQKGKEVWRKHLVDDLGGAIMDKYGYSESPLIDGKHLICTPGGPKGTLAALDKTNGNVIWRSKGLTHSAPYASPVVAELHGVRQYIQTSYDPTNGSELGAVSGFDAKTGKVLWSGNIFTGTNDSNGIGTTPIVANNQVFASSVIGGTNLFEIDDKQKSSKNLYPKLAAKKVKNAHGGVVLLDGNIYGHSDAKTWFCQDMKTGKSHWTERIELSCISGATITADGLLYLYTDDGVAALVEPNTDGLKVISRFTIPVKSQIPLNRPTSRQSQIWAHPVIANGHLYLRDHEFIYVYKIAK